VNARDHKSAALHPSRFLAAVKRGRQATGRLSYKKAPLPGGADLAIRPGVACLGGCNEYCRRRAESPAPATNHYPPIRKRFSSSALCCFILRIIEARRNRYESLTTGNSRRTGQAKSTDRAGCSAATPVYPAHSSAGGIHRPRDRPTVPTVISRPPGITAGFQYAQAFLATIKNSEFLGIIQVQPQHLQRGGQSQAEVIDVAIGIPSIEQPFQAARYLIDTR